MSARFPRWSGLFVALALAASVVGLVPATRPAAAYGSTVEITGHGWGHGRGLGQWGSLGYALDGVPYPYILNWFYGGTSSATRAESLMTVNLTEVEDRHLIVTSESAFSIDRGDGGVRMDVPAGQALRVRRTSDGWAVDMADDCSGGGGWELQRFLISPAGDATYGGSDTPSIRTDYTGDSVTRMLRVCSYTGNVRSYRGHLTAYAKSGAGSWAVNTVPMEQYLRGVVPRESPAYWGSAGGGKGMEALKAQAVAARSYALAEQRTLLWKAYDDTRSQVYGGAGLNGQSSESTNTDIAIAATAGEIRQKPSGAVARTEFSSSTGGYTAGGDFDAVADTGDDVCASDSLCNPNHDWTSNVSVGAIEAAYPTVGTLREVRVTSRNGLGEDGGRVTQLTVTGSNGSTTSSGEVFRARLGLKSDWFSIESISVRRLSGKTRLGTAIALSKDQFGAGSAGAVVLASSSSFADAMVAAPLALAKNGPVLLTNKAELHSATFAEIQRVLGSTGQVYVVGGQNVISSDVVRSLTSAGYVVRRRWGQTRAATAVQVAVSIGSPRVLFEVSGQEIAEGLAASAAAAKTRGALLLTNGSTQAPETSDYIADHATLRRFTVGAAATSADNGEERSYIGANRYDTAVKLAKAFYSFPQSAGLASGERLADGLAGAAHAARAGGPLLLTTGDTLSGVTRDYLLAARSSLRQVVIYGGTSVVSTQVATEISGL
jgi:SpoIID/LytB domain protein